MVRYFVSYAWNGWNRQADQPARFGNIMLETAEPICLALHVHDITERICNEKNIPDVTILNFIQVS